MTDLEKDNPDGGIATLAADNVDDWNTEAPFEVSGVALPVNTVVNGGQNTDHFYSESVLEDAAEMLEGQQIVKNFHDIEGQASADQVIGKVTDAGFEKGVGLVFSGEMVDNETAEKVAQGYLDVSPTVGRQLGEFNESMGAQAVERISGFRDLAVVANGQPGASIEPGSNAAITALSMDALSRGFDVLQDDGTTVAGVTFVDTGDGELDESEIPNDDFEPHYLYPGDTKSESSYPVVDADGVLRKGNVEAAWSLGARGDIDADEHDSKLMELADEFDDPPEFAQEEDTMSEEEPETVPVVDTVPVKEQATGEKVTFKEV
jgi:hypothetical protein